MIFNMIKFVDKVHLLAEQKNISIGKLEKEIGVAPGYFSRVIQKNTKSVSLETALRCAKIFECSVEDLL